MPDSVMPDTSRPTCFVIIGYGRKTDPATGRTLDLDKTFEQLIQPACDEVGLNAFRAIDANLTGSIDELMHRWIGQADYVIADLTTLNANVFYELGVRHALRSETTILIADRKLIERIPFDLSSFVVHAYDHPDDSPGGPDGDTTQDGLLHAQARFSKADVDKLSDLLAKVRARGRKSDSPVYVFLPGLDAPDRADVTAEQAPPYVNPPNRAPREDGSLADVMALARAHRERREYEKAIDLYRRAIDMFHEAKGPKAGTKIDVVLYQNLAEVTSLLGRTREPQGEIRALREAESILKVHCALDITTDARTLAIAGDIYDRLFTRYRDLRWWRLHQWAGYRALARKFFFSADERVCFEHAIDCYERAWSSSDNPELRRYAERAAEVLRDVARSTWNPVLKLRYYSEASTRRRRAWKMGPQSRLQATAALLLLLLLGTGYSLGRYLGAPPILEFNLERPSLVPSPQPLPTVVLVPDRRPLDELMLLVTEIRTAVGTKPPDSPTLLARAGGIDQRTEEILNTLLALSPTDLRDALERLIRIERSTTRTATVVGVAPAGAEPDTDSILSLVKSIDGTTRDTSKTAADIRRTVGTTLPPTDAESIPEMVKRIEAATGTAAGDARVQGEQDIINTAWTILDELRRLASADWTAPATLARTGPAMQFGSLPRAVRGFAYSLGPGQRVRAGELGLEITMQSIDQCQDGELANTNDVACVWVVPDAPPGAPPLVQKLFKVAPRPRGADWTAEDTPRAEQFRDEQGFWYAMVVNRNDAGGRYAVIRRCNEMCEPGR